MSNDDLDLVETQDLIDALHRRTGDNGCVLVALGYDVNHEQSINSCHYRGPWPYAYGLAEFAKDDIKAGLTREPDTGGN